MFGMASGEIPPEMANNPMFAMMQNMLGGGAGVDPQQQQQQALAQKPKSSAERLLPLVHLLSSVAIVSWAVWNSSHLTEWHALSERRSALDYIHSIVGLHKQLVRLRSCHVTSSDFLGSLFCMPSSPCSSFFKLYS
jgi:hypothetical protein